MRVAIKTFLPVGCGPAWHLFMVFNHTTGWLWPGMASFKEKGIHRHFNNSNEYDSETDHF